MLTWGEVSNTCTCPQEDPCLSLATLAFPCFDGLYLPKQESVFLHDVKEELEVYLQQSRRQSVLLFPPLPSRLRYLIHRTTEDLPELATFSVGDSWCRRVVVCHAELRYEPFVFSCRAVEEEVGDWEGNDSFCEQPLRNREEMGGGAKTRSSFPSRGRGPKRPDKALYMPRAARERLSFQNSPEPPGDQGGPGPASSSCIGSSRDSCFSPEATEDTSPAATREQLLGAADRGADSSALCPPEENRALPLTPNEAEPLGWQQTVSCFKDMTLEEDEKGKEDVCTDADDIKAHLKEPAAVSIQHVHNDYSVYESEPVRLDKLCHVIEIYDFPHCFKTDDLVDAFTDYRCEPRIEWVDDTHALGVFSTETAGRSPHRTMNMVVFLRRLPEFIQPVKERPRTDSAVARRMVTRALGMQGRGRRGQRY
uniref:R3H domain and coiled-coil containing 1 n=1 Tax=Cyclopterus lumpus TaxID=8103 RepID=A0A8C3A3E7_CYCLU